MELLCGVSEKNQGQMNLKTKTGRMNRRKFFSSIGIKSESVVACRLNHDKNVEEVNRTHGGRIIRNTDGLITIEKNLCLSVAMADCLPIIFFDKTNEAIGIAHAGWRGVIKKIATQVVEKMHTNFASIPQDIAVLIGPHIKQCHFSIKGDIIDKFSNYPAEIKHINDDYFIDLGRIVKVQLIEAGLQPNNIAISEECSYCNLKYFSSRRDKNEIVQPGIAYICMK